MISNHWTPCLFLLTAAFAFLPAGIIRAAPQEAGHTLYVDFDGGADGNTGLAPDQAFKHAPGDPAAMDKASAIALEPGDKVIFKGGVSYRGNIVVNASGVEGRPIVFDGNSAGNFGSGRAIVDGSDIVGGWQACASAADCGGNPNWKSIDVATLDAPIEPFSANMYQGDRMCWLAQDPHPPDPFYQDRPDGHHKISQATGNTITDAKVFTQPEANAWDGAWLIIFAAPNYPYFVKITAYDPATHQVTHTGKLNKPTSYAVLNSLRILDTPGEYVIQREQGQTRVFLWPLPDADLPKDGASITRRGTGFAITGRKYVDIQGFVIQKFCADEFQGAGLEIFDSDFISARDNIIQFCDHGRTGGVVQCGAIHVSGRQGSRDVSIENNQILDNRRCSGLLANPAEKLVFSGNTVRKTGYVGIWFMHVKDSEIVGNTVADNHGVHSNAISVYANSQDILVASNRVRGCERPLTLQDSTGVTVFNNALISDGGPALGLWSGDKSIEGLVFANNLFLNAKDGEGIYSVNKVVTGCTFQNNIMGDFMGEAPINASANKFVDNLYLNQNQRLFDPSEKHILAAQLFVDPANEDYQLKADSPASGAGAPLPASLLPKAEFPDFDFSQGAAINIGPKESGAAAH